VRHHQRLGIKYLECENLEAPLMSVTSAVRRIRNICRKENLTYEKPLQDQHLNEQE